METHVTAAGLPPEVRVEELPGGVRYVMPQRPSARGGSLVLAIVAAVFLGFGLFWQFIVWGILAHRGPVEWAVWLIFAGAGLVPLAKGLRPALYAVWFLLPNHAEFELTEGRLRVIEYAGLFRWTRWRGEASQVRSLRVALRNFSGDETRQDSPERARWAAIVAEGAFKKPLNLIVGYPREMLIPIAEDLARRLALASPLAVLRSTEAPTAPKVEIEPAPAATASPDSLQEAAVQESESRPAGARAEVVEAGDILTIQMPPQGFRGSARQMLIFSLFWTGTTGLLTAFLVAGPGIAEVRGTPWPQLLFLAAFGAVFWGIGIGMLLSAIQMARRRGVLVATPEELVYTQTGPLGKKELTWPSTSIASIQAGPSGTSINNVPVLHLEIRVASGDKQGILAGCSPAELRWLAALLRRKLGRERSPASPPSATS